MSALTQTKGVESTLLTLLRIGVYLGFCWGIAGGAL